MDRNDNGTKIELNLTDKYIEKLEGNNQFIKNEFLAIDIKKKLMWHRYAYGNKIGKGNFFVEAEEQEWNSLDKILDSLNKEKGYLNYNDWRIPTIDELLSIVEIKPIKNLYIDQSVFYTPIKKFQEYFTVNINRTSIKKNKKPETKTICKISNESKFWTSSTANDPSYAWYVNFSSGLDYAYKKTDKHFLRLVRTINEIEIKNITNTLNIPFSENFDLKIGSEKHEKIEFEDKIEVIINEDKDSHKKIKIESFIEDERKVEFEMEHESKIASRLQNDALQQIDSANKALIEAVKKIEIERQAKEEAQRQVEISSQEKLEAERKIENEVFKNEQLKAIHQQQLELEKIRLKFELEKSNKFEIERLQADAEKKIKFEIERFKAEMEEKARLKAVELLNNDEYFESVIVQVETKKTITVPLLKDEATQNFEDMF
jgi:hypothetical protein